MSTIKLNTLETKVLSKFGLTEQDIFLEDISRNASKEITDAEGEVKTQPATTYINIRGYVLDDSSLKLAIFPETNELSCRVSTPTDEVDEVTNKKIYETDYVKSNRFKELLADRRVSSKEDIDSI